MQLWPGEGERVRGELLRRRRRCVAAHDRRRRVAELEVDLLARGALADSPADVARAGERDQPHALVLDEHVADLGGRPDDDAQPARRQAGLFLELGEQERRERRLRRRLQHDRAACREGRRDLVRDEVEREVERRDRADDADRHAERERELSLAGLRPVHRDHLAGERSRHDCGEGVGRHRARRLDARRLHRLAGLLRDRAGDLLVPAAERTGDLDEDLRALVRGQRVLERAGRGVERAARLVGAALRDAADHLARVRRAHVDPLAGLDPLAGDEQLPFGGRRSHAASLGLGRSLEPLAERLEHLALDRGRLVEHAPERAVGDHERARR